MAEWPAGVGREILESIDSTSAEALRRAAVGEAGPLWLMARAQTAGHGRRGRPWAAPQGNFAATLLFRPTGGPAEAALRSFVAALAVHESLVAATGRPERFALKWPNDVLLDGRKLAGILLETDGPPGGTLALALGVGVNLAAAPPPETLEPGALAPIALAAAFGDAPTPEAFLDLLAPAVAAWEARLAAEGFAPIRAAWLARAARLGQPVVALLPSRRIEGRFETIDAAGALVLATAEGRVVLPAAEVHFAPETEPADAARD